MAAQARKQLQATHPGVQCSQRNPRFYNGGATGIHAANVVCVGPDARKLVSDYEAAGVEVIHIGQEVAVPPARPEAAAAETDGQPAFRRRRRQR